MPETDEQIAHLLQKPEVQRVIDPVSGQVIAAGDIEREIDVIDVIARRFEAYHATMKEAGEVSSDETPASIHDIVEVAPSGWREGHGYDRSRRGCFSDYVLIGKPSIEKLARVEYQAEIGPDSAPWELSLKGGLVELNSTHGIWTRKKVITFKDKGACADLHYTLSRTGGGVFEGFFLMEFNLGMLAGDAPDRYHLLPSGQKVPLSSRFELDGAFETVCVDEWSNVQVRLQVEGADWSGAYPVNTLSRGEGGLEMNFQGSCVIFRLPLKLEEGSVWTTDAKMMVLRNR